MSADRHSLLYFLLFALCEILFLQTNSVSGNFDHSCSHKPRILLYHTPTQEQFSLDYEGCTVVVKCDPNTTTGSATGGSLGNSQLALYKFSFHWTVCDDKITFETYVIHYDKNKGTFEDALAAGAALLTVIPVEANGWIDDPLFYKLEKIMQHIQHPGDCIKAHSTATYLWFRNFPLLATYDSFKGSYTDKATGQLYEGITVIRLPPEPWRNFMSRRQFDCAFGHLLKDSSGQSIDNSPPEITRLSAPVKASGLIVKLVLG